MRMATTPKFVLWNKAHRDAALRTSNGRAAFRLLGVFDTKEAILKHARYIYDCGERAPMFHMSPEKYGCITADGKNTSETTNDKIFKRLWEANENDYKTDTENVQKRARGQEVKEDNPYPLATVRRELETRRDINTKTERELPRTHRDLTTNRQSVAVIAILYDPEPPHTTVAIRCIQAFPSREDAETYVKTHVKHKCEPWEFIAVVQMYAWIYPEVLRTHREDIDFEYGDPQLNELTQWRREQSKNAALLREYMESTPPPPPPPAKLECASSVHPGDTPPTAEDRADSKPRPLDQEHHDEDQDVPPAPAIVVAVK
ncbi:MAG: hypothetical protein CL600_15485 [Alteromonas sp.]|nr:hypothetical protein [Alteromonas sp.]